MQINNLKRNTKRARSSQVGRGGKRGKTSGRGHKGQKQHGGHGIRPHMRDVIKKLPKLRGRGVNSNKSIQTKPQPVNLSDLEKYFNANDIITPDTLLEKGVIKKQKSKSQEVKILGTGELTKKLAIENCLISESAESKIVSLGGSVKKLIGASEQ